MEMKELRCFSHVAETLNFNRAAEQLSMSQSVVTKTIAQLERKLGVKLFDRTTRRVALTPAGVVLRRELENFLAHADEMQRAVRHAIGERSGRFVIGVTPSAMRKLVPQAMRQFRELHPEIDLEVRELASEAQLKALSSADIDVGFLIAPAQHPALEVHVVYEEEMRLAVPADHPHIKQLGSGPIPLCAFAGETFVIPPRVQNPGVYDEMLRACSTAGFRPRVHDCHENQTCIGLVEAGMGVSFVVPKDACSDNAKVCFVELEKPAPIFSVAVAWRRDDPSPLLTLFRELALGNPVPENSAPPRSKRRRLSREGS